MNNNHEAELMANEICRYIVERRDKKELALLKEKPEKEKGGINIRLVALAGNLIGKSSEQLQSIQNNKREGLILYIIYVILFLKNFFPE